MVDIEPMPPLDDEEMWQSAIESINDKFWKFYSDVWDANKELHKQLRQATRERDEERALRALAETRLVEMHMDKVIEYESLDFKSS